MRLSHLRCLLSSKYKVARSRIVLRAYVNKSEYDDKYDYYLSSFKRATDNKLLFEIRPNEFLPHEAPRHILANSALFPRLLALLNAPNEDTVNIVWQLLLSLPPNEVRRKRLQTLALPNPIPLTVAATATATATATVAPFTDPTLKPDAGTLLRNWEAYLEVPQDYESMALTYDLHVLTLLLSKKDDAGKESTAAWDEYKTLFEKQGGVAFLISLVAKKKLASRHKHNLNCLEYALTIINLYLARPDYALAFVATESSHHLWHDVLTFIQWVATRSSPPPPEIKGDSKADPAQAKDQAQSERAKSTAMTEERDLARDINSTSQPRSTASLSSDNPRPPESKTDPESESKKELQTKHAAEPDKTTEANLYSQCLQVHHKCAKNGPEFLAKIVEPEYLKLLKACKPFVPRLQVS